MKLSLFPGTDPVVDGKPLEQPVYAWLGRLLRELERAQDPDKIAALSVLGRAVGTFGPVGAIAAAIDGYVLRRLGSSVGFGKILTKVITGTGTNDNAAVGDLGEYLEAIAADDSVITWTSNVGKDLTSKALAGGDYLVVGEGEFGNGAITGSSVLFGISTVSATFQTGDFETTSVPGAGINIRGTCIRRITIPPAGGTVYLVGRIIFSAGTPKAGGALRIWRTR